MIYFCCFGVDQYAFEEKIIRALGSPEQERHRTVTEKSRRRPQALSCPEADKITPKRTLLLIRMAKKGNKKEVTVAKGKQTKTRFPSFCLCIFKLVIYAILITNRTFEQC